MTTPPPASAQAEPGIQRLETEVGRLARLVVCTDSDCDGSGTVGVAAIHLETGQAAYLNRGEPFPMASTYKVPVAVRLLSLVDRGALRLDSMVALTPADLHPGSGTLSELFDDPGVILSARNLLELMLLISDNSATDIVMRLAGGAEAVTAHLRELGIEGISVDRPTVLLIADYLGISELPPPDEMSPERFRSLYTATTPESREEAAGRFDADPRDTATPEGMGELLRRLWEGELLSDSSTALLLDIMTRSTTGTARIKGLLPPGTEVAHKTGTIGGTTNDVGIVTLPEGAGHVVTVVFVKESERDVSDRERAIAHIARAVYDYFLFTSPAALSGTR
jgi:beta-lactamase class A